MAVLTLTVVLVLGIVVQAYTVSALLKRQGELMDEYKHLHEMYRGLILEDPNAKT